MKQNSKGVSWKDYKVAKYCPECMKRVPVKLKEERHSN
jgi:rubredoxin